MPVEFIRAITADHYAAAASLFREYAAWLGIDLSFQQFDAELNELTTQYGGAKGGVILCKSNEEFFGCAGVRELDGDEAELKRMYIRTANQGKGYGQQLLDASLELARGLGYNSIRLDTLDTLTAALQLYLRNGFVETPPYYHNPNTGVVFLQKQL